MFPFTYSTPNLTVFEAVNTNMIGSFPSLFWFPDLQALKLSHNQLTGTISQESSSYNFKLQTLWLDHQETGLSGSLDFLVTLTQLAQVWVNNNAFSGSIPDLWDCTKIFDLQLNDNQLLGFVPNSLSSLPNLLNISLQNNNIFFGTYPNFSTGVKVEIGNTSNFCVDKPGVPCDEQVDVLLSVITEMGYPTKLMDEWRGNNACKWKFIRCDDNGNVTTVNLAGQQFEGYIPTSLSLLTTLLNLYLNDNAFSGDIPEPFTFLPRLKVLDVSNNYLTGMMPKFESSVRVNVTGNMFVANESIFEAASASIEDLENPSPRSNFSSPTHSGSILGMKVKTFIPVCVALSTLVLLTISTMIYLLSKRYKKRRHENKWEEDSAGQLWDENRSHPQAVELGGLLRRFSYENLKLITGNFDPKRKLGGGGFGSVYEGNLVDGTKVAVKHLDRIGQGRKEFVAEVMTLGIIHHVNLVKLIGFCDENAYRLLVYEHMSNGSLDKWIFQKQEQQESSLLSWNTRKNIILQIAKGLAYLHEECQHRIAHLDIKPQNILLDENFNAKVADFGLAKLIDREESFVMTQMRGTRGYLAPEWLSRKITEKADVYSFGVVLLEVVFGRRNLEYYKYHEEEEEERGNGLLVHVVKKKAEANRLLDLVEGCYQGMDENGEEVEKMVKFAIFCLHENPTRRPTMSTVVKALEGQMNMVLMELESNYSSNCTTSSDSSLIGSSGSSSVSASVLSGPR